MTLSDPSKTRKVPVRPWVVLLVDDEPDVRDALADVIENGLEGVRVLRAASGREGLALLRDERVDAILSDFKMAGMDGLEFLYLARQQQPLIPRIMLTAYAQDLNLTQRATHEAAVQAFLPKPVDPEGFLDSVLSMLSYEPAIVPSR